jgi:hypothetical protein
MSDNLAVLKDLRSDMGVTDEGLSKALEKLQDSYLRNMADAERFLQEIDASFAKAVLGMKELASEIRAAAREMTGKN